MIFVFLEDIYFKGYNISFIYYIDFVFSI